MKSKKAGVEIAGEETTSLVFGIFAFILIVVVVILLLFSVSTSGPDTLCKIFASANAAIPGNWLFVPKHFCQPRAMIINSARECECGVFRSRGEDGAWLISDCERNFRDNDRKCDETWQRRYVMFKLSEFFQRCWQMGSSGRINPGKFGCFMVKVYMESDEGITPTEMQYAYYQYFRKISENADATTIHNPLGAQSELPKAHGYGEETITSNQWVGVLHCGATPIESGQTVEMVDGVFRVTYLVDEDSGLPEAQRILYFAYPIASEIERYMSIRNMCRAGL